MGVLDVAHPQLQINGLIFVSSLCFLDTETNLLELNFCGPNYVAMNAYLSPIDWDSLLSNKLDFIIIIFNFYSVILSAISTFLSKFS